MTMAPEPGCTLIWCVPPWDCPRSRSHCPVVPGPGCRPRKTPHRRAERTCITKATLRVRAPMTAITVPTRADSATASGAASGRAPPCRPRCLLPTCVTGGCSSKAGETDRVRISALPTHQPCGVSWQRPSAGLSLPNAETRVKRCDQGRSRALS
jgi:hypothetical protein